MSEINYDLWGQLRGVHGASYNNRKIIEASQNCGCYSCLEIFPSDQITLWSDRDTTAICPKCFIDSVLGDKSGYQISKEALEVMHRFWFAPLSMPRSSTG